MWRSQGVAASRAHRPQQRHPQRRSGFLTVRKRRCLALFASVANAALCRFDRSRVSGRRSCRLKPAAGPMRRIAIFYMLRRMMSRAQDDVLRATVAESTPSCYMSVGHRCSSPAATFTASVASAIVDAGTDIRTVEELLGHNDVKTTDLYPCPGSRTVCGTQSGRWPMKLFTEDLMSIRITTHDNTRQLAQATISPVIIVPNFAVSTARY